VARESLERTVENLPLERLGAGTRYSRHDGLESQNQEDTYQPRPLGESDYGVSDHSPLPDWEHFIEPQELQAGIFRRYLFLTTK
jgi:hypothetical protein